jgi:hypothetical protein
MSKRSPGMMAGVSGASLKDSQSLRGMFYPRRITYTLSGLKIAGGCGLVLLGALALYQKASYAKTASGLWAGFIIIISGNKK